MAGGEGGAGALEDDRQHPGLSAHTPERAQQLFDQVETEGVALVGPVQRDECRRPLFADEHGRVSGERLHSSNHTPKWRGRHAEIG